MAKRLDKDLFHETYLAWKNAPHNLKGEMMESGAKLFGFSTDTLRRRFALHEKGENISRICGEETSSRKSRMSESELELKRFDIETIAAEKFSNLSGKNPKPLSTELAIQICHNKGLLKLDWTIATADRHLAKIGLTSRMMSAPTAALTWKEPYSNSTHMVDASVLNRYYLNPAKKKVKKRAFFDIKDEETAMMKDGLIKVWIYALVDVYSKSFFVKAYGGKPLTEGAKHRGENSIDYIDFFKHCWIEKEDRRMPVHGIPDYIYTDQGAGLKALQTMLNRLGIVFRTHKPGAPRAKGPVERRIGIFKNGIEPALDGIEFDDLEDINQFLFRYCIHQNQVSGKYDKWVEGTKAKAVRRVTLKNFHDASSSFDTRTVDNYGCVSIGGKSYAVANDLVGQKVTLYRDREGQIIAEDSQMNLYTCDPSGARGIANHTDYHIQNPSDNFSKTERERNREAIKINAKTHNKTRTIEDILPDEQNLRYFPVNSVNVETQAIFAPKESKTIEEAWSFIERKHGIFKSDLPEEIADAIDNLFAIRLKVRNHIPDTDVYDMCNLINQLQENQIKAKEN
ncbi:MAG: transposase family protein [Leptospira sp.]|nr:transposase family protein [Leptospira sp.]